MTTVIPPMKWAQRKESVFVTITVTDIEDTKVDVSSSHLTFSGRTKNTEYGVTLNFYKDINPEKSKWSCTPRCVQFHLMKDTDESWPQLLKNKNEYKNLLQIDWALWADSDDEEDTDKGSNFQLPPNFQDLMKKYNDQPEGDECGCGGDHCGCGDDHCGCIHDSDLEEGLVSDSSVTDSDDLDEEDMPPLEEDN